MSTLTLSSLSDTEAVSAVKVLKLTDAARLDLWRSRYGKLGTVKSEHGNAESYSAFMEGAYCGRVRVIAPALASKVDQDALRRAEVRKAGLTEGERVRLWGGVFAASPSTRTEFRSKEIFSAFMEGEFARGR